MINVLRWVSPGVYLKVIPGVYLKVIPGVFKVIPRLLFPLLFPSGIPPGLCRNPATESPSAQRWLFPFHCWSVLITAVHTLLGVSTVPHRAAYSLLMSQE